MYLPQSKQTCTYGKLTFDMVSLDFKDPQDAAGIVCVESNILWQQWVTICAKKKKHYICGVNHNIKYDAVYKIRHLIRLSMWANKDVFTQVYFNDLSHLHYKREGSHT